MENQNADSGQAQNAPEAKPMFSGLTVDQIADQFSTSFLSEPGKTDLEGSEIKPEEETAETEATAESEQEVLSQDETNETTEDETESESEAEKANEDEEGESERGLPKGVKKRIDKLTAKRREAEAEVERLKSEMENLRQEASKKPVQNHDPKNPYSNLSSMDLIQKEMEQARQIRRWCELNPDGATVKDKEGNETDYSAEDVRNIKIKAMDAMEEHLPKQARYLEQVNHMDQIAVKEYPWWKDKAAKERVIAEKFLEAFPEIRRFPDYKVVVGDYLRGIQSREAASRTKTVQRAPVQPRPGATPAQRSERDAKSDGAKARFMKSTSSDDLADIIASKFLT
jgi:hypothetical protein